MRLIILIDIGSTFTKVSAVDISAPALLANTKAPTTPDDVSVGLDAALSSLKETLEAQGVSRTEIENCRKLACSSAAGGLRMVAVGLVADLTAKAAKLAALGAGARVLKTYSFQLTDADKAEIEELQPDIILLAGGTDGGNQSNIIHNAKVLGSMNLGIPVVIAGNRSVSREAASYLSKSCSTYIADNVMPEIGKLQVEPARNVIRQVFMEKIIYAKGLAKASRLIEGIFMPTPAAVLRTGVLLSKGAGSVRGWGDLMIVDVGGATTDVHSIGSGNPTKPGAVVRGLPEPFSKRTVEGDLGVRVSAVPLVEVIGPHVLGERLNMETTVVQQKAQKMANNPEVLPETSEGKRFDQALGYYAAHIAVGRHVGHLKEIYTPSGVLWVQEGKDLSNVQTVIGTGGVFISNSEPLAMLRGVSQDSTTPFELRPENPTYYLDRDYLMAPIGLLAEEYPEAALSVLANSLEVLS
ncbi:MAG: MutL protein [Firmicutes bacterium]|nr:MutL protein [Bacillota bacterium]